MKQWEKYLHAMILFSLLLTLSRLLLISLTDERAQLPIDNGGGRISFQGEYSIDGAAFQSLDGIKLSITDNRAHTVVLRGHFSQDILPNQVLMMQTEYLSIRLSVNGVEKFSYGTKEKIPQIMQTGGNVLQSYTSDGIYVEDLVEITLHNVHALEAKAMYAAFLDQLYVGSERFFYMNFFQIWVIPIMLVFFIIGTGVFSFFVGIGMWRINRHLGHKVLLYAGMAISGGLWALSDYQFMSMVSRYTFFNELAAAISGMMMLYFCAFYIRAFLISEKGKMIIQIFAGLQLLYFLFVFLQQISGRLDLYMYSYHALIILVCMLSASFTCIIYEVIVRHNAEAKIVMITLFPFVIGVVVDAVRVLAGNEYLLQKFFFIGVGVLLFIFAQIGILVYTVYRYNQKLCRLRAVEQELAESRIAVMQSQIQPHFLYNALASIRALCTKDPSLAKAAITNFSYYLRGNLNSLRQRELIPFAQELTHLKHYLAIEKLRFGDRIDIVWNIAVMDFFLPALTLQPMVENAIRHGMMPVEAQIRVMISTNQTDRGVILQVIDNGCGFSMESQPDPGKHIGIQNTRSRVAQMCGGTLTIESRAGNGTFVTIFLPRIEE